MKYDGQSINGVRMFCDASSALPLGIYTAEVYTDGNRIATHQFKFE
ncbi:MAG: hypothetical protein LIP09_01235 [Bacteroidales bacterium]|nr:hypothetical protein [Bacteroidales bacterium]